MRKIVFSLVAMGSIAASQSSFASDSGTFTGPQPVTNYTVCQQPAVFAYNKRQRPIRRGQRQLVIGANTATLSRTPDLFFGSSRLVQNSYTYLTTDAGCYPP